MAWVWTPRFGNGTGTPDRCRASVRRGDWHSSQCERKPVVFRAVEGHGECGFCKQHDPEAVSARRDKSYREHQARWDAERAAAKRLAEEKAALAACKTAIEQIAAGHNDPRSLAGEVLALFPPSPSEATP